MSMSVAMNGNMPNTHSVLFLKKLDNTNDSSMMPMDTANMMLLMTVVFSICDRDKATMNITMNTEPIVIILMTRINDM
jgi:hypothetical protein